MREMLSDPTLRSQGETLMKRLGTWELLQHVGEIERSITRGHRQLKSAERTAALGLDQGKLAKSGALREFAVAKRHSIAARKEIRELTNAAEWKKLEKAAASAFAARDRQLDESLAEARERWVTILADGELSGREAAEVVEIWDATVAELNASSGDITAVMKRMEGHLARFDTALTQEQDWARKPASPLETWQWIVIGIIIGVAVAAVLACLFWSGCSWIGAIFAGLCWGTGAVGGWSGLCAGFTF